MKLYKVKFVGFNCTDYVVAESIETIRDSSEVKECRDNGKYMSESLEMETVELLADIDNDHYPDLFVG